MSCSWKLLALTVSAWFWWLGSAQGQSLPAAPPVPAVPGIPSVAAPAAAPVAAPATAAAPQAKNLWTFLCPPPGCCDKLKQRLCASFIGQYASAALAPMRMATGGMMQPCCPGPGSPTAAGLAQDADTPGGAAARIKQDEAEAKARRADVRYLGTVDCHRYPEAEKALIKALRTDHNECVRLEAALSLGNGCCCTKNTVEALLLTVSASDKDGNPIETSPRVKWAAAQALAHCQERVPAQTPEPPEKAPPIATVKSTLPGAQAPNRLPSNLMPVSATSPTPNAVATGADRDSAGIPNGERSVFQIFMRRVQSTSGSSSKTQ